MKFGKSLPPWFFPSVDGEGGDEEINTTVVEPYDTKLPTYPLSGEKVLSVSGSGTYLSPTRELTVGRGNPTFAPSPEP